MKNPLHYQLTEYDCGPTTLMNAVSFLFAREDIPPEVIRNIMLYSLDCYGSEGTPGKEGTSCTAMMFLSNWLDGFGHTKRLLISTRYLSGKRVSVEKDSELCYALQCGGVAVVRLYFDEAHYVLLTGIQGNSLLMFDPYYVDKPFPQKDIIVTLDHPFAYNRVVPFSYFNQTTKETYALGAPDSREAVLIFNEKTRLTAEKTIEYYI